MSANLNNWIVFEGLDGCGKSTQEKLLAKALDGRGLDIFRTAEPTEGKIGQRIRRILRGEEIVLSEELARLYAEDRKEHLYGDGGVFTQLDNGFVVIQSRYMYSSYAYQAVNVDREYVMSLNRFPHPGTIIFIDVPPEECIRRIESRGEGKELFDKLDYLTKVRANFMEYFKNLPPDVNLVIVDGTKDQNTIAEEIQRLVKVG